MSICGVYYMLPLAFIMWPFVNLMWN